MRNIGSTRFVAFFLVVIVVSIVMVNLVDGPSWPTAILPIGHVNVPLGCDQGLYLADHHCVAICPSGYFWGYWTTNYPPGSYTGSPCMTKDDKPVSIYDLAGLDVSSDNGSTVFKVVPDVPLVKVHDTGGFWHLRVSSSVLDSLPTLASEPSTRTEIASIGDRAATLKIFHIGPGDVTGNRSTVYPIEWCCQEVTIHIGDEVGTPCAGLSETLSKIDYFAQKAAFTVHQSQPTGCPICLSGNTLIQTPTGEINVKNLTPGMIVWTTNAHGQRVSTPIIRVGSTHVSSTHRMVHLLLSDGRELYASPGHPTTDGRTLGQLKPGDRLDGSTVVLATLTPYDQAYTYDLLPSGDTGYYWANGILVASSLI